MYIKFVTATKINPLINIKRYLKNFYSILLNYLFFVFNHRSRIQITIYNYILFKFLNTVMQCVSYFLVKGEKLLCNEICWTMKIKTNIWYKGRIFYLNAFHILIILYYVF